MKPCCRSSVQPLRRRRCRGTGLKSIWGWSSSTHYDGTENRPVGQPEIGLATETAATGKSTFLNALLREISDDERLILIEDTPELQLWHENAIGLLAARSELGQSLATSDDLLNASLRMRPDRIILGEIRGPEAFTFLRAINTGHPGSMSTIHADSPERAIEQLALLVLLTGTQLRREDVIAYVEAVIDIFVQLDRCEGERRVGRIRLNPVLQAEMKQQDSPAWRLRA